ncbi:MAG: 6,7-dimethyl-8-ribityllumazine synthase [Bacteroidetes bacterium]|nr:6,7-dimethyl-8-ribityllumazine synthase [Bacteroidota bacterium]HET6244943.1 6,7-dimethyl-8-ribityllumazine synthase [Bacteroidia bacterium]
MATALKNLSDFSHTQVPSALGMRFGIVVAEWNAEITNALAKGAIDALLKYGAVKKEISIKYVPGAYELALGAQFFLEFEQPDAVICLGCVIQGDTKHFDFICEAASMGIKDLNLKYNTPVIFGVLTPNTYEQAQERAGGIHGNKGEEAAVTAIKMSTLKRSFKI